MYSLILKVFGFQEGQRYGYMTFVVAANLKKSILNIMDAKDRRIAELEGMIKNLLEDNARLKERNEDTTFAEKTSNFSLFMVYLPKKIDWVRPPLNR